jgi:serine protease inhibitor ecotin
MKLKVDYISITDVKPNPENPRLIKTEQLDKLKKSIQEFPEMLEARPLVVDENNVVIGGNMRLRALTELGYDKVPVVKFDNLSTERKREFVVKDNVNYGDWNWDQLSTDWNLETVGEWGLDLPNWVFDDAQEPEIDVDIMDAKLQKYIDAQIKKIILFFNATEYEEVITKLNVIMKKHNISTNTEAFIFLLSQFNEDEGQ